MIRVKALNKLLSENADGRLVRRWFVTTPNGSLLAYTSPTDMRELRDSVALISMTWKEQLELREDAADNDDRANLDEAPMHTMTMEFESRNVLVRLLQPNLLLVLEGGVPPRRSREVQVVTEGPRDQRYPASPSGASASTAHNGAATANGKDGVGKAPGSPSGFSEVSTTTSTHRAKHVLDVHRRKLDAMTTIIRSGFNKIHFEMPEDPDGRHL